MGNRALGITCLLLVFGPGASGFAAERQDAGHYRVKTVKGGFAGFGCQPRTEFYFLDPAAEPLYLGTCGTTRFVATHLHMPADPACFAVAEDGASLVYFHLPDRCGAGERARQKPGGVYLHSARDGDRLLYRQHEQVTQLWSADAIGPQSIRVRWVGAEPSRSGASCPQRLVIDADGSERADGDPGTPDSRCRGWQGAAGAGGQ